MYSLILILSMGVQTVGTYATVQECQSNLTQFTKQDVKAACVRQQSPDEAMRQAQAMFKTFRAMMEQQ